MPLTRVFRRCKGMPLRADPPLSMTVWQVSNRAGGRGKKRKGGSKGKGKGKRGKGGGGDVQRGGHVQCGVDTMPSCDPARPPYATADTADLPPRRYH